MTLSSGRLQYLLRKLCLYYIPNSWPVVLLHTSYFTFNSQSKIEQYTFTLWCNKNKKSKIFVIRFFYRFKWDWLLIWFHVRIRKIKSRFKWIGIFSMKQNNKWRNVPWVCLLVSSSRTTNSQQRITFSHQQY